MDPDEDKRRVLTDMHNDLEITLGDIVLGVIIYGGALLWAAWRMWG